MAEVMRFAASNVQEGVVPDSGSECNAHHGWSLLHGGAKGLRAFLHLLRAASAA